MHEYAQPDHALHSGPEPQRWPQIAGVRFGDEAPLLLAFAAAAIILIIDDVFVRYAPPLRVTAPLDEVAHGATMILLLCALAGRVPRAFVTGSLLGAVVLDIDHLSIVFHLHAWAPVHGRPYSHSLLVVAAVALLTAVPRGWRVFGIGMACGLLSHLFRDLATGVVPLFWPLTNVQVSIPYFLYSTAVLTTLAWVLIRRAEQWL